MVRATQPSPENAPSMMNPRMDVIPVFHDEREVQEYLGTKKRLEELAVMSGTKEGEKEFLTLLKRANPSLNGNIDAAHEQADLNIEQLEKKKNFLQKMLSVPGRALKSLGRTMKKHTILTALGGLAAVIALLYFMPALAPTTGKYGRQLIEAFKEVLKKVGLPTPTAGVDAIAELPVTGGPVSPDVVERAGEILESSGTINELSRTLQELSK